MSHETTTVRLTKEVSDQLSWLALQVGCRKGEAVQLLLELAAKDPSSLPSLRDLRISKLPGGVQ